MPNIDLQTLFRAGAGVPTSKNARPQLNPMALGKLSNALNRALGGDMSALADAQGALDEVARTPALQPNLQCRPEDVPAIQQRDWVPHLRYSGVISVSAGGGVFDAFVSSATLATDTNREFLRGDDNDRNPAYEDRYCDEFRPVLDVDARLATGEWDEELSARYTRHFRQVMAPVLFQNNTSQSLRLAAQFLDSLPGNVVLEPQQIMKWNHDASRFRIDYNGVDELSHETLTDLTCVDATDIFVTWGIYAHFIDEEEALARGAKKQKNKR